MKIFFSVGEPSGDLHGANLIEQLRCQRSDIEFVGYGGPRMARAGCRLHEDLTQRAVMWFARALLNVHTYLALLIRADRYFRHQRPAAVVLIDYPGFNWWIARRAKAHGIPVFYYGAPQLWAWASWRVGKMRRNVDHVLCKLPFEEKWFQSRGCNARYVGHPYFDELEQRALDEPFINCQLDNSQPLVTILPGSRRQEVTQNLPTLLKAAVLTRQAVPEARFCVASFNQDQADIAREMVHDLPIPIAVHVSRTAELVHASNCCMACSGSVSLELLYYKKPAVVIYRVSRWAYLAQACLRRVRYISLVNLLAARDIFRDDFTAFDPDKPSSDPVPYPEYLTFVDKSACMARHIVTWLSDSDAREQCTAALDRVRTRVARGGASKQAARYIVQELERRVTAIKTHYPSNAAPEQIAGNGAGEPCAERPSEAA